MSDAKDAEVTIGVLALQGAFCEHIDVLTKLGVRAIEIRKAEELVSAVPLCCAVHHHDPLL